MDGQASPLPGHRACTHHGADDRRGELRAYSGDGAAANAGWRFKVGRHRPVPENQSAFGVSRQPYDRAGIPEPELFRSTAIPDLGNFVAFGIATSFLLSITFLPALLSLLPIRAAPQRRYGQLPMRRIADFALRYRRLLVWVGAPSRSQCCWPFRKMNSTMYCSFLDERVEFRRDTDFLDERFSAIPGSITPFGQPGRRRHRPGFLTDVSNFADWYREQPSVRYVSSISDTFRQINQSMHGDDPDAYLIPESRELAAQYLLLYELSLPQGLGLNNQIDVSRTATRVSVSATTLSSRELLELNSRAEAWIEDTRRMWPRSTAQVGDAVRLCRAAQHPCHGGRDPGRIACDFRHSLRRPALAAPWGDEHRAQLHTRRGRIRHLGVDRRTGRPVAFGCGGHDHRHRGRRHRSFPEQVPSRSVRVRPQPRGRRALRLRTRSVRRCSRQRSYWWVDF